MTKISFWVDNESLLSGITTLQDGFSIANIFYRSLMGKDSAPLFETEVLTTDGAPVKTYGGIKIVPDGSIRDVKETDCIFISPFLPGVSRMPGKLDLLKSWVESFRAGGSAIATTCTGTFILAEMGVLEGKIATTNWHFAEIFMDRYPGVRLRPEFMLTEDQGFLCTGAATAVYNLGIHLIKKFGSHRLATLCAKALLVDPNRNSQAPYIVSAPLKNHGDQQVLKAQQIIESSFSEIDNIDDVARAVGISSRHFKRRFKRATGDLPLKYLQRIRIDAAKEKLETTKETIADITWMVGYKDISSFCRLFKQYTNLSPNAYRDKFFFCATI